MDGIASSFFLALLRPPRALTFLAFSALRGCFLAASCVIPPTLFLDLKELKNGVYSGV